MAIVHAIHGIVNPNGKPADPIDRYLAKEAGKDCAKCGTKIKVYFRKEGIQGKTARVDTTRFFGMGVNREDAAWRVQCREENMAVEKN